MGGLGGTMNIPIELLLFLLGLIVTIVGLLYRDLKTAIKETSTEVKNMNKALNKHMCDTVTHTICTERRDRCSCVKDIEELKEIKAK
jgi:hypothetical protein